LREVRRKVLITWKNPELVIIHKSTNIS